MEAMEEFFFLTFLCSFFDNGLLRFALFSTQLLLYIVLTNALANKAIKVQPYAE